MDSNADLPHQLLANSIKQEIRIKCQTISVSNSWSHVADQQTSRSANLTSADSSFNLRVIAGYSTRLASFLLLMTLVTVNSVYCLPFRAFLQVRHSKWFTIS